MSKTHSPEIGLQRGSALEVLLAFLRLGCTSFGGPIAHLGYFRAEFVEKRQWCSEAALAELIALAQSLPGPASSQVGFALGLLRAGWMGGLQRKQSRCIPNLGKSRQDTVTLVSL